jgi:hypothetical protein
MVCRGWSELLIEKSRDASGQEDEERLWCFILVRELVSSEELLLYDFYV